MLKNLIDSNASIVEALDKLNRLSGETMTLFVVDGDRSLRGSLTDGDIRRALLAGKNLSSKVADICKRECLYIDSDHRDIAVFAEARRKGIMLLPLVKEGRIEDLIDLRKTRGMIPADAILMAGGRGERLMPLTEKTPKPLLPVGGTPIIDHNIRLLKQFGVERIFVTVNYLKEQIIRHIGERWNGVTCVAEPQKLGTMGSAALVEGLAMPDVVVMNSDLLTDINLEAMYLRHSDTGADITVAVVAYPISVPFAIVEHQGDIVKGLEEKPTYNYYANAGIYIIKRKVVERLPKEVYLDAPDLINRLIKEGGRVAMYVIEGRWKDIGSPDDYRLANETAPN